MPTEDELRNAALKRLLNYKGLITDRQQLAEDILKNAFQRVNELGFTIHSKANHHRLRSFDLTLRLMPGYRRRMQDELKTDYHTTRTPKVPTLGTPKSNNSHNGS